MKGTASFMGLFGPGAQVCKPKPFISGVHTKVTGEKKKNKPKTLAAQLLLSSGKLPFKSGVNLHSLSTGEAGFVPAVSSGPLLRSSAPSLHQSVLGVGKRRLGSAE